MGGAAGHRAWTLPEGQGNWGHLIRGVTWRHILGRPQPAKWSWVEEGKEWGREKLRMRAWGGLLALGKEVWTDSSGCLPSQP